MFQHVWLFCVHTVAFPPALFSGCSVCDGRGPRSPSPNLTCSICSKVCWRQMKERLHMLCDVSFRIFGFLSCLAERNLDVGTANRNSFRFSHLSCWIVAVYSSLVFCCPFIMSRPLSRIYCSRSVRAVILSDVAFHFLFTAARMTRQTAAITDLTVCTIP